MHLVSVLESKLRQMVHVYAKRSLCEKNLSVKGLKTKFDSLQLSLYLMYFDLMEASMGQEYFHAFSALRSHLSIVRAC